MRIQQSILSLLFISALPIYGLPEYTDEKKDIAYSISGMLREDMFAAKNFSLFNNLNGFDKVWFERHTLDFNFNVTYGKLCAGHPLAEFFFTLRNKGVWGNPSTLAAVSEAESKWLDVVGGEHSHFFGRHIFWMREAWLRLSIPETFSLPLNNPHTFMLGFFPFQLGRAIALGDAYAVGHDFLGFYVDGLVDQFAPAAKISGQFIKDRLFYDLYAACLENFSASITDTGAKIRSQEKGQRLTPQRGFGRLNLLAAGRLRWLPLDENSGHTIIIELYFLFNNDPEVDVEFTADAASKLGTIGIAVDYINNRFEGGFEFAFNKGFQEVRGWDRNTLQFQNRNGQSTVVNSHVLIGVNPSAEGAPKDLSLYQLPYAPKSVDLTTGMPSTLGKTAQDTIDNNPHGEIYNGMLIEGTPIAGLRNILPIVPAALGAADPNALYNARNRYRNEYDNTYKGWMFVADAAFYMLGRDLRLSFEGGIASGDHNPNFVTKDGDYAGFIGLQETYSGRKVRSAFVLGGAGKMKRPLSAPEIEQVQAPTQFATNVSGFTNLKYLGTGLLWNPADCKNRVWVQPNVIAFWQDSDTPKFDIVKKRPINECASPFLGVEANLFAHYMLYDNLKLFVITSAFFPGQHYTDIKGFPLNSDQQKMLERLERNGESAAAIPNIGDNAAFTFNVGLEFKF